MKIYHEKDIDMGVLEDKTIAVIGYGSQGRAQALNMRDSGLNVIVGVRKDGKSWNIAKNDGMEVTTIEDASKRADIVHVLIPDEVQPKVYENT